MVRSALSYVVNHDINIYEVSGKEFGYLSEVTINVYMWFTDTTFKNLRTRNFAKLWNF